MQTRMKIAKKIARAVGTVIKKARWSSTSCEGIKSQRHFRNTTVAVIYVIKVPSTFITVKTHWVLKVISEAEQCELTTT